MSRPDPTYLALGEALRFPAGSEDVVVEPTGGQARVISIEQARVLGAVNGEHTLAEHAALSAQRLGLRPEMARALVEALAMKGLLIERAELLARIRGAPRAERERAAIETLGVPARGRTASVVACVKGHLEATRAHGRRVTAVVADSAEQDASGATRAALGGLGAEHALRFAGQAERARFAALLAPAAGVDPEVVRRALVGDARIGVDTGANRNTLLLDCAGEALVMADDDVRARFTRAPFAAGEEGSRDPFLGCGLRLMEGDPFAAGFADPGEDVVPDEGWIVLDPFALHEALLGVDVARVVTEPAGSEAARRGGAGVSPLDGLAANRGDRSGAGAAFFRKLVRRGGRVAVTQLGCAGDHGMGASTSLLLVRGATRERLLASEARLWDALARRRILRSPERATISDTDFCMSMHLGVDNRALLPPFPFAGRHTDGVFGALLHACAEDAFAGFLPWAIAHRIGGDGEAARGGSLEEEIASAGRSGVNDVLRAVLAAIGEPRGAGTAAHLASAGVALERLAARPREADFFFREQVARALGRALVRIEQRLDEHDRKPAAWAGALVRLAGVLRGALADPALHLPADLVTAHGVEGARALFFEHTAGFGRLLAAWPALVEAARRLRAGGERLSAAIPPP